MSDIDQGWEDHGPLTPQAFKQVVERIRNAQPRQDVEAHAHGCAKFYGKPCDCGARPMEQVFQAELAKRKRRQ